jgi:hypothetical protein
MRKTLVLSLFLSLIFPAAAGYAAVTTPMEEFGFDVGADYHLISYSQMIAYWKKLEAQSNRLVLVDIGTSSEGRTMWMAVITSSENHKNLDRYKEISRRLALAEGLDEAEAQTLAQEGRAVVWIDGGLHGSEVLGAQQLVQMAYEMVNREDRETLRFLDDDILLLLCSNPDGMELLADWYMRNPEPEKRTTSGLPRLYHKYIGHDNNRDFYMSTQVETIALNRILYREWFPQIVYNHHQSGPSGTVLFAPPFRDPFNYVFDPLVPMGIELVGTAMHTRFIAEGKPGSTMREGAGYSTWWNGGLRTTTYFHNMIGILTETIGHPTPNSIPFIPARQLASGDLPSPIAPQEWHFRQSVEYAVTANRAILDVASKHREDFLMNIFRMGRNSIHRGSRDNWTILPGMVDAVTARIEKDRPQFEGQGRSRGYPLKYYEMMRTPQDRDPRGYIIPADQPDFLTAIKFANALIKTGVTVLKAEENFTLGEKTYPSGSLVVKCAQAFRPHILTMFEPQDYPDNLLYPGGPPIPTYDNAGWTLAYQMGVRFDRILEAFDGLFQPLQDVIPPPARVLPSARAGYYLDPRINDSFIAVNRLLAAKKEVLRCASPVAAGGTNLPAGAFFVPAKRGVSGILAETGKELGLPAHPSNSRPGAGAARLKAARIGLWDSYGGSINSGWLRWLFEQFEFPYELVYAPRLDEGNLDQDFDVLIVVSGAIRGAADGRRYRGGVQDPSSIPEEYRHMLGRITEEKTIPQLKAFLEEGNTILTIGSSTALASHLELPVEDALVEKQADGTESRLPREKYFIPGSILQARVNKGSPLAWGLPDTVDVTFNFSPVFKLLPQASLRGVSPVAWYEGPAPLRSGWAWGQHYVVGGLAVVEAKVGKGSLALFGPEIAFRAQPHGTFKLLFNGIFNSTL